MNNPTTAMMNPILANIRIFKPNLAQNMFFDSSGFKTCEHHADFLCENTKRSISKYVN